MDLDNIDSVPVRFRSNYRCGSLLRSAIDVGAKYQVGIRSVTNIISIDNFTGLRGGKLVVASWGYL